MKKILKYLFLFAISTLLLTIGCSKDDGVFDGTSIVTFDSQNATIAANPTTKSVKLPSTTIDALPIAPIKTGYIFDGWFYAENGNGSEFTENSVITGNITVYAKWNNYNYAITFDSQNATVAANPAIKNVISPETTIDALPTAPTKTGNTFGGWHTEINGGGIEFISSTIITGNITVYAKWTSNPVHTVIYDSTGGTTVGEQHVIEPSTTINDLPTAPTKNGYIFDGWYTEINGGGTEFTNSTTVTENIIIYAKWNSYNYVITFNSQDATVEANPTIKNVISPETTINALPTTPTKTGNTFGGWYTETNGGGTEFTNNTTVTENITIYAKWTEITYISGDVGPSGVGIVFYTTDGGRHGLEAAPALWNGGTEDPSILWSNLEIANNNTSDAIGTGQANTNAIINQDGHLNSAAKKCKDYTGGGKTDWFLPSQDELWMMNQHRLEIGGITTYGGGYWSSTEYDWDLAWYMDFGGGNNFFYKTNEKRVRPVREF